ncbi:MAG TPA: retropepsin-like aspartic protease [Clostridia bacterium]|nr:retropepsin-like aspartic protease [Clostridia bacterium]
MRFFCLFRILIALAMMAKAVGEEIPFRYCDGLIRIEVQISSSQNTFSFLLDSGAQASVVDARVARQMQARLGRSVQVATVGGFAPGFWTELKGVRSGELLLPSRYVVLDLRALGNACTNGPVHGIIGYDFFRSRTVQIDYQRQVLSILSKMPAQAAAEPLPLKVRRDGLFVPVAVNGGDPRWVRLDTGCASALHWFAGEAIPAKPTRRIAAALHTLSLPVAETTVVLGSTRLYGVQTDLHAKKPLPGEQGLLGNGLLSRFQTVIIDPRGRKLLLGR